MAIHNIVRFDWAIKKLLRNKANYDVLEGFLTVLLGRNMKIQKFLDTESNQDSATSKFNRVDMLVEDEGGELIIIEVQNDRQLDYYQRMLYGTSKTIVEHIDLGEEYARVKKVYSINIVYFNLGQGSDYAYKGQTSFRGIHDDSVLGLTKRQKDLYSRTTVEEIFPEYYLLRVEKFNHYAKSSLDEWISFLKTGEIEDRFTAPGLSAARTKLQFEKMSPEDRAAYLRYMEDLRCANSTLMTSYDDGMQKGLQKGRAEGIEEGRAEGIEKGRAEGIEKGRAEGIAEAEAKAHEEKLASALAIYKSGSMPLEQIAAIMKLDAVELAEYVGR